MTPLGINSLYAISKTINSRLPKQYQIERPTGHSGRHTFISNAINSGVDPETVAKASKHKDVNCVQKYYHPSNNQKMMPAMSILDTNTFFDDSGSKSNLKSCGSAVMKVENGAPTDTSNSIVQMETPLKMENVGQCIEQNLPSHCAKYIGTEFDYTAPIIDNRRLKLVAQDDDDFEDCSNLKNKKKVSGFTFTFSFE